MKRLMKVFVMALTTGMPVRAATNTSPSASFSDVSQTYSNGARGDTLIIPPGTNTWTSTLTVAKGHTIISSNGATTTVITRSSGTAFALSPDATALANGERIGLVNLTINANNTSANSLTVDGAGDSATKAFTNLFVSGIKFKNNNAADGVILCNGQIRGVFASIDMDRCHVIFRSFGANTTTEFSNGNFPYVFGTVDQLFLEDWNVHYSSSFTASDPGWIEIGQGARVVIRYSTWDYTNTDGGELWDIHGFQNWPGGQTGTMSAEAYGNVITNGIGLFRWMNHRGIQLLQFNNLGYGVIGSIDLNQYTGCHADVPGTFETQITNSYFWNNLDDGAEKSAAIDSVNACSLVENTAWWNYNAACTGSACSAGVGRGTTAPTGTCTTGVGFWVASTSTATVDPAVIQNGVLYKATASNTWTPYYTPFTYPHPMRSEAVAPTFIPAPTGLRIRSNR